MAKNLGLRTIFVAARPTAMELQKAKLVVVDGPDLGVETVINKYRTFIGRSSVNDLTLEDQQVSSTHAEIEASEDGYVLRDLGSTNGTFYEDARIREVYLRPEMRFTIGRSTLQFVPLEEVVEIPLSEKDSFGRVTGRSLRMREIFALMEKVAPSDLTVLITGETGTGKERLARSIHDISRRAAGPYVVLDCSAIPRDLAESTVFGHEKGAFTGATSQHKGAFEQADGGTIFLDEVGELELSLQPKLLRVLENREIKRVGGDKTINADVRVVAATNRDLRKMVAEGTFREDLYFRLSVIQCQLPPLRERKEDVELLVDDFLNMFAGRRADLGRVRLSQNAMKTLLDHSWPGNVRELKNVIERAVSLADKPMLEPADFRLRGASIGGELKSAETSSAPRDPVDADDGFRFQFNPENEYKDAKQEVLDQFERIYLQDMLDRFDGNLSKAARNVGLTRYHLRELLKKHELLEDFRS